MIYSPSLEIYESFKKGSEEAFEKVYKALYKNAYYFIGKRLDNFHIDRAIEVEDILSRVFIKLWLHREKMERPEHLYHFVFTACRTEMIDLAEKIRTRTEYEEELSKATNSEEFDFMAPDILQALMPYVEKLPHRRRNVFKMYLEGKSTAEIQEITGMQQQTVLNHKNLAIGKLRSFKEILLDY